MPNTLNIKSIATKVSQSRKFIKDFEKKTSRAVRGIAGEMVQAFDEHKVTQEIQGEKDASNITGTLDGRGNLFTFIGFREGSDPTASVRNILLKTVKLIRQTSKPKASGRIQIKSRIRFPKLGDFDGVARMPWQAGSWVKGIENGISGFGSYIYWKNRGRSGGGLQAKDRKGGRTILRSGDFTPTIYLTGIINKYTKLMTGARVKRIMKGSSKGGGSIDFPEIDFPRAKFPTAKFPTIKFPTAKF